MRYRWQVAIAKPSQAQELARQLNISALLAQCLLNRHQETLEAATGYLEPRLKNLADPFLIPDMARAVDRLIQARAAGEPLVIFGDYDVDGVSATTLLVEALTELGLKVFAYLPHRVNEGYGLSLAGVERCLQQHPVSLLLAVDCGTNSTDVIEGLGRRGVDVIVLDHHQVTAARPSAVALVNPHWNRPEEWAFRELCAAGLAFKLIHALVKRGRDAGWAQAHAIDIRRWLDLIALATIADLVPLTGENRILVNRGLEYLQRAERPGIRALLQVAGVTGPLTSHEVAFQLAPRLNAAGRLETAQAAFQLLKARSVAEAEPLARQLDQQNRERQTIERSIATDAIRAIRERFDPERDFVIVEGEEKWHVGVVGIVASRVAQEFYRPAIILGSCGEEAWRGSGRSIEGFDMGAALKMCEELVLRAGGHGMAAGLSLMPSNVIRLRERLNLLARSTLQPQQLQPSLRLDAEVQLGELSVARVRELRRLETTGVANPSVNVCVRNLNLVQQPRRMGSEQQHLKFEVSDAQERREVVWWRAGDVSLPDGPLDLAVAPQLNIYGGTTRVQLKLLDWQRAGQPLAPASLQGL